ncbi:MAG: type II glyceraldehyde-3-phosphate dehydrogenase [Candidatus Thermoplasmatota archaeon]|nr:type II glyceraldehyde-3-phosphate dehydrogenase [Candidatus Thermoplasmatota archaeon]
MLVVKVAINGYGTIGKRVADAISLQDDMKVVGVTKTQPTVEARLAIEKGYPLYGANQEAVEKFKAAGLQVEGTLDELLKEADIVVDGTPGKMGDQYKSLYNKAGIKAIWQGGEKHELAGFSFNALCNYQEALGKDMARVVSCNTTGLCRTLYPLDKKYGIKWVNAVMIRRSADPRDSKKGPINAIEPVLKVPSHHGPDVQSVLPHLNIQTTAVKVPTTIMHLHSVSVGFNSPADIEGVLGAWKETPRVMMVKGSEGVKSTAQIMEYARDLGRNRSDLFEIAVWEDGSHVKDGILYYYQAIHQESDVIPENVDAIRAMCELETDGTKSMAKTDKSMGII